MAVGACIAIDPRKAEVKGHGFIMLILSVMFLCILAAGTIGLIGEYTSILLLFAGLMIVGFLVGAFTHLMVFLTATPEETVQKLHLNLEDYKNIKSQKKAWDLMQEQNRCCGITGPDNWLYYNLSIPSTCCHPIDNSGDPPSDHCALFNGSGYIYRKGCSTSWNAPRLVYQTDEPDQNTPKRTRLNFKQSVIYMMVFDYISKIVCIVSALAVSWLVW
ncbi:leukocyte surface antigen CD53-like isoform X2 [Harmonia axyridis]|nr:leukocyte surface antigen CD53-like isoform X2 [Harmonia axyridis]